MEYRAKVKDYFKGLEFSRPEHRYYVNGEPLRESVSAVVKRFYKPFEGEKIAKRISVIKGVPPEQLLRDWKQICDEACERGTLTHAFAEEYFDGRRVKTDTGLEESVVNFWGSIPDYMQPAFSELQMYHRKHLFAGTSDLILRDKRNDSFTIVDYKSNKDLFKNYQGQTMLGMFENYLDTPYNRYSIQLGLYQLLFEQTGFRVNGRKLVWLQEHGEYEVHDTEDVSKKLNQWLEEEYR